jgi:hypothetical protein
MQIDVWPLKFATVLHDLSLRYCLIGLHSDRAYTTKMNALRALTLVSDHDICATEEFRTMLNLCKCLKKLTLLVGGRYSKIPLELISPVKESLEMLVIEARRFAVMPAMNYHYSLKDLTNIISELPNLTVLGLPIAIDAKEESVVSTPKQELPNVTV